jgi:hypothetical protein
MRSLDRFKQQAIAVARHDHGADVHIVGPSFRNLGKVSGQCTGVARTRVNIDRCRPVPLCATALLLDHGRAIRFGEIDEALESNRSGAVA